MISDMISGIQQIKCNTWEHLYLERIKEKRKQQEWYLRLQGLLTSVGGAVFHNGGLIAIMAILLH